MNTRRRATIPAELRALALQGRSSVELVGSAFPASPPGPLPPQANTPPRLVEIPVPPFDPGTPPLLDQQAPPPIGFATDIEAQKVIVPFPPAQNQTIGLNRTFSKEVTVYVTQKRWRGCDVWLDFSQTNTQTFPRTGFMVVRVYGITQGTTPTLVAQGMVGHWGAQTFGEFDGRGAWAVAARAIAEKFQITIQYFDTAGPAFPVGNLVFTIGASDENVPVPWDVGAILASGAGPVSLLDLGNTNPGGLFVNRVELLYVQGVNNSGAAAWMQAFDGAHSTFPAGKVPDMVWPLGAASGEGFAGRVERLFGTGFALAASSTPDTYTALATAFVQALIR